MRAPRMHFIVVAAAACFGAGCSHAARAGASAPRPGDLSPAEFEALYRARADSARMHFTNADVHFMTGMIGHHAQAIVMSRLAPTHGAGPSVRRLAARIINAQEAEILTMQHWLGDRKQPVPQVQIEGLELRIDGAPYTMHMPGMLTEEQLRELDQSTGTAFDRLFLTYMIQHHGGAITMVHDLFGTDGAAQDGLAFKLANDIQVDQTTEIARMRRMLAALHASSNE